MHNVILYCPYLNRDLRPILSKLRGYARLILGEKTPAACDGCLEGHHDAVRWAASEQASAIFFIEDDCQFTDDFDYERWCETAVWARDRGYDVITGGCVHSYEARVVNPPSETGPYGLIEVSAFHSAHCVIYLDSSYEKALRTTQPHDASLGHNGCRCLVTWPFVAVQRPSFSGILLEDVNYLPLYHRYEERLGAMLDLRRPQAAVPGSQLK
jgi:hypothetical protein